LFQASDADGDGLTYFFYDNSADPTSGHFTVNGVVQAAGTTFAVSAAQLAQTTFTAGSLNSDDLFVNVHDGMAFSGLACTRFRGHRVRCHSGAGGGLWNANAMHESSSLRL
jgi:hypothetical protein